MKQRKRKPKWCKYEDWEDSQCSENETTKSICNGRHEIAISLGVCPFYRYPRKTKRTASKLKEAK